MLSVSQLFKEEIRENTSLYISCKIEYNDGTEETIGGDRIMSGSVSFDDSISASGTFEIGSAIVNTFSCTLNNYDGHFDDKDFTDAIIFPTLKKDLSDGTTELIPRGMFIVEQPSAYGNTIALTCNDNMILFEKDFSGLSISYPITLGQLARQICNYCGVVLANSEFDKYSFSLTAGPDNISSMTCLDVIGAIAQISGNYATIDENGRLRFKWHSGLMVDENNLEGGSFSTTTTPYSDGDDADGGDFTFNGGDSFDGGTFEDLDDAPYQLYAFSSFEITTDPVIVTGLKAITEDNEYLYGSEGYVLEISNDFITDDNAQSVVDMIGPKFVGMTFRPFNVSALTDPALQCGDIVYIVKNGTYYRSTITHLGLKLGGYSTYECSAETPSRNSSKTYSNLAKTTTALKQNTKKQLTAYDVAVQTMNNLISQSFGVFRTEEVQEDGSVIYYLHNKPKLADSSNIWRFANSIFSVSDDGGETWRAGIDSSGKAVVNVLSAIGINADWINTGSLQVGGQSGNVDGEIIVLKSDGTEVFRANKDGLTFSDGAITWSAVDDADTQVTKITKDTVTTSYVNSLSVTAGTVACENLSGTYIRGKVFMAGSNGGRLWASSDSKNVVCTALETNTGYGSTGNIQANGQLGCTGNLIVGGSKSRITDTDDYNTRMLYCYEMPSPIFGDIGEGSIDDSGECYVFLDDIFGETIDTDVTYQVFLQKYGEGDVWVSERNSSYFVVKGTVGLSFGWEIKATQLGYDNVRLEEYDKTESDDTEEVSDTIDDLLDDLLSDTDDSEETETTEE